MSALCDLVWLFCYVWLFRWLWLPKQIKQIWSLRNVPILFRLASVENGRLIRVACLNFDSVLTDMKVSEHSELGFGN